MKATASVLWTVRLVIFAYLFVPEIVQAGMYEKVFNGIEYGFNINSHQSSLGVINSTRNGITIKASEIVIETSDGAISPCGFIQPVFQTVSGTSGSLVESITIAAGKKALFPMTSCIHADLKFGIEKKPISIRIGKRFVLGSALSGSEQQSEPQPNAGGINAATQIGQDNFKCPESLANDVAREKAMNDFVTWAGKKYGNLSINEIVKLRMKALEQHNCRIPQAT